MKKIFLLLILSGLLYCAMSLTACGGNPSEQTPTKMKLAADEHVILTGSPVAVADKEAAQAVKLFQNNPSASGRYPVVVEGEYMSISFEPGALPESFVLEEYVLNDQGNLTYQENVHQVIELSSDETSLSFNISVSPDWGLSSTYDPGFINHPQGYVLRCETKGQETIFVFRVGVLPPYDENNRGLEGIKPAVEGGAPDLSSFNMIRVPTEEGYSGGLFVMTAQEQQALSALLNEKQWKPARVMEARDLSVSFYLRNPDGVSLWMEDNAADDTAYVLIKDWQGTESLMYEAPRGVASDLIEFAENLRDEVD
jgi:hypothetical protein